MFLSNFLIKTETSETGNFSTHLFSQAENIILNSFNVTKNTHFAMY